MWYNDTVVFTVTSSFVVQRTALSRAIRRAGERAGVCVGAGRCDAGRLGGRRAGQAGWRAGWVAGAVGGGVKVVAKESYMHCAEIDFISAHPPAIAGPTILSMETRRQSDIARCPPPSLRKGEADVLSGVRWRRWQITECHDLDPDRWPCIIIIRVLLLNKKSNRWGECIDRSSNPGFGGFFWHGAWDWGVELVCKCMKGNRLRSRGVLV